MVPLLVGITSEQFDQFINAFVASGMLQRREGKLFLQGGQGTPGLEGLLEQVLGRVEAGLGRAA